MTMQPVSAIFVATMLERQKNTSHALSLALPLALPISWQLSWQISCRVAVLVMFLWLAPNLAPNLAQAEEKTTETPQEILQDEKLTLDATVRKMLRQNGEFLAEKFNKKADNLGRLSALSELLPSGSLRYNSGNIYRKYTRIFTNNNLDTTTRGDPISAADTSLTVSISQPLYSRRFYRVAERFANYKGSQHRLQASANAFILETIQAYFEVQTATEERQYAEKNLEDIRRLFDRVRARARVDPGQRYLLNRAQTRLSLGEEDLSRARQLEVARRSKLARLIGQQFGMLQQEQEVKELPSSVEESLVQARRRNPDLLAARAEVKSSVRASAGAWGALLPEISLDINYRESTNQSPNESGSTNDYEDLSVGIGGSYQFSTGLTPIFDAMSEHQRLRAARFLRRDAEQRIEEEVNNAWVKVEENRRIHAQAVQFLKATEREKEAYRRQFRAGQRNLLDLLNIQGEFFSAQQRELSTRVQKEVSRYQILAIVGDLVDRFGGI